MLSDSFLEGFTSLFYSSDNKPLAHWKVLNGRGYVKEISDDELGVNLLEIVGPNVSTTYVATPVNLEESINVKLPILVVLVKNLKKYFTFEVQFLDDTKTLRKLKINNWKKFGRLKNDYAIIPLQMHPGWNIIQFDLAEFTKRVYGTNYLHTVRIQINANIKLRQLYFTDQVYTEEDLRGQKISQSTLTIKGKAILFSKNLDLSTD